MGAILNLDKKDMQKITDIIVSFSLIDDMLCNYILEYNKLTNDEKFSEEAKKISNDRSNISIKDKIECLVSVYPNHPDMDGKIIQDLRSSLCAIKNYRNEVAHNRRFSLKNGTVFLDHKTYTRDNLSLSKIHDLYEKEFRKIEPILKVFYSDWDYRKYFLYDIKDYRYYE